jgi:transposase
MQIAPHQQLSRDFLDNLNKEDLISLLLGVDSKYNQLAEYVRALLQEKYGRKTERFENPDQLRLLPDITAPDAATAAAHTNGDGGGDGEQQTASKTKRQKQAGHGRKSPPDLPRVPITAPTPDPSVLACSCCGAERTVARQILQCSRYQFVPAQFYFEDLMTQVYSCTNCQSDEELIVPCPEIVKNGKASAELLAQIAVARDCDHIPFNRQSTIYRRSGAALNRSTLGDHYSLAAKIVTPIANCLHQQLLQSAVVSFDETPVKVQDRSKSKKIKTGRVWVYFGDDSHPAVMFDYTDGRGRDGPLAFLSGYTGILQGDCYSGNLSVCSALGVIFAACNAHSRRYFAKALPGNRQDCNIALSYYQDLYEIERTAKELELPPQEKQKMREQESLPILKEFHAWLQKEQLTALPRSNYAKAIHYCLSNWQALTEFVKDGRLNIDNNHCEREMKYIAMGRKAWLFFGSDRAADDHAKLLSIISTCRRHNVDPWAYLTDVIKRLSENPNENPVDLLPYNWKPKTTPAKPAEITAFLPTPKVAS